MGYTLEMDLSMIDKYHIMSEWYDRCHELNPYQRVTYVIKCFLQTLK